MQVIDSSIVNVALPAMMGNLGASLDQIAWISTGYILSSVVIIPLTGWLGDRFGRKRYFVSSILIFTFASIFCGISGSFSALIFWRVIQGLGGGALMTVSQAVLFESFPTEEAGTAMALFGLGVMVGPTIGPTLGGWLTDNFSWPWIFYINVPVGILAAMMITTYVNDTSERKIRTIDFAGIAILIISAVSLQYVLEHGQRDDWFRSNLISGLTFTGLIAGAALVWRELTTPDPVIDFRVLRHRPMWVGTLLGVVLGLGLYASVFTLPIFLQGTLHMTAEQTGLILLPGSLSTAFSMLVAGRLIRRLDGRIMVTVGALVFALSMWQMSQITSLSGAEDFTIPLILRGIGLGLMFVPLTTMTLASLEGHELAQGSGLYNFFRQMGGSFGIAMVATLLTRYTTSYRTLLSSKVAASDPLVTGRLSLLQGAMGSDPVQAHQRALALIDHQITAQASVIANARLYLLSAAIVLVLIPLLSLVPASETRTGSTHQVMGE